MKILILTAALLLISTHSTAGLVSFAIDGTVGNTFALGNPGINPYLADYIDAGDEFTITVFADSGSGVPLTNTFGNFERYNADISITTGGFSASGSDFIFIKDNYGFTSSGGQPVYYDSLETEAEVFDANKDNGAPDLEIRFYLTNYDQDSWDGTSLVSASVLQEVYEGFDNISATIFVDGKQGAHLAFGALTAIPQSVPEPSSLALLCLGLAGLSFARRCNQTKVWQAPGIWQAPSFLDKGGPRWLGSD